MMNSDEHAVRCPLRFLGLLPRRRPFLLLHLVSLKQVTKPQPTFDGFLLASRCGGALDEGRRCL